MLGEVMMHGGSGLSDEAFAQAIKAGVTKINVDTELRRAFMTGIGKSMKTEHAIEDFVFHFRAGEESLAQTVREKLMVMRNTI